MDLQYVYGCSDERGENGDGENSLLYADEVVLCGKLEQDLEVIVEHFVGL